MDLELGRLMTVFQNRAGVIDAKAVNAGLALKSAHSTGIKTRSVTGPAPLNLVGGYRFSNATEIEANLAGYIRATEACLLRDECVVELPTVESPPLISPDPFDIPSFLDRRVTAASSVAAPSMSCLQTVPDLGRAHCRCLEILDCSGTKRCACQH